jgi:ArsR family transcriptional regulator, cadmium/lead-responsive transcriptional repressor
MSRSITPLFAALADDTRRAVLDLVAKHPSITSTALAEHLGISRQAIAKHLDQLRDAGLVASMRSGRETRYTAVPAALRPLSTWVDGANAAWTKRLDRLAVSAASRSSARRS